jgi:hypothetical protein
MKDAYELLHQKEEDLLRVRREVESLTIAAWLLGEGDLSSDSTSRVEDPSKKPAEKATFASPGSEATGTDGLRSNARRPRFWNALKRRR